jgi:hypothetical protein
LGSSVLARLELRWSDFCDTVWAKVVNLTGSGTGYASARSLTSDETIYVYSCPYSSCLVDSQTELNDVLPSNGSSGWSHQLDVPAGGTIGSPAAKQPPSVRFKGTVTTGGTNYTYDSGIIAFWNWSNSGGSTPTCNNSATYRCVWWGEPAGDNANVWYELTSSLSSTTGSADLAADLKNIIFPGWSEKSARSPKLSWCNTPCTENVLVSAVPSSQMSGLAGATAINGNSATPALLQQGYMKFANDLGDFDHSCGTADDGCAGGNSDDRPLLSHETAHSLGFGHCNLNNGAVCWASSTLANAYKDGNMFWTPRARDIMALKAMYP